MRQKRSPSFGVSWACSFVLAFNGELAAIASWTGQRRRYRYYLSLVPGLPFLSCNLFYSAQCSPIPFPAPPAASRLVKLDQTGFCARLNTSISQLSINNPDHRAPLMSAIRRTPAVISWYAVKNAARVTAQSASPGRAARQRQKAATPTDRQTVEDRAACVSPVLKLNRGQLNDANDAT